MQDIFLKSRAFSKSEVVNLRSARLRSEEKREKEELDRANRLRAEAEAEEAKMSRLKRAENIPQRNNIVDLRKAIIEKNRKKHAAKPVVWHDPSGEETFITKNEVAEPARETIQPEISAIVKGKSPRVYSKEKSESLIDPEAARGAFGSIMAEAFGKKMRRAFVYSFAATILFLVVPIALVAYKGFKEKGFIEMIGNSAYGNLKDAQASIEKADIAGAGQNFDLAHKNFLEARQKLDEVGGITSRVLNFVPGVSKVESGRQLAMVGENISLAGKDAAAAAELVMACKNELADTVKADLDEGNPGMSLTDMVISLEGSLRSATGHIGKAEESIRQVNPGDFPGGERQKISTLAGTIPEVHQALEEFLKYTDVFLEILGHNGERKYLLLFENNHEMRATGGFIGTYGIVKVDNGRIENVKVDGIYNPDGQLKERIVPPEPIQKMSATWTMHDANWWPDFPTSAEKIGWFYEKTGGPTVDGAIAMTPVVIKDLLKVTGPIEMPEYGTTVTADNFMDQIQEQVEVKYDKTENKPKKILADLTPKLMDRITNASPEEWGMIVGVLSRSLKERHLMVYSFDYNIQQIVSDMGWSGEMLATKKDYLSVINTNISGFKTDGVIEQKIVHTAEIQDDGSIIDTVTIERKHTGGLDSPKWHNAVNSDWMRVYVPEGSRLISASGFTREFVDSPLDYEKIGFKQDPQVKIMEDSYQIDDVSATRVYKEKGKTVFGNWVYASPGETTTVSYKYLLPFKFDFGNNTKPADTYSVLYQKQAGDENTIVDSILTGLDRYEYIFKYPQDCAVSRNGWEIKEGDLNADKFYAIVAKKRE